MTILKVPQISTKQKAIIYTVQYSYFRDYLLIYFHNY